VPALATDGWQVRAATRDVTQARERQPELDWVSLDVGDAKTLGPALDGCDVALTARIGLSSSAVYDLEGSKSSRAARS
jgi:uncharacterized protein YbjT (DUF2867 family)